MGLSEKNRDNEFSENSAFEDSPDDTLNNLKRRDLLGRIFKYLLRYRLKLAMGIFLSFLASILNLFSIAGFVPVFNMLGQTGELEVFGIEKREIVNYERFERGEDLFLYEKVNAFITKSKMKINSIFLGKDSNEAVLTLCAIILPLYLLKVLCIIGTLYLVGTSGLQAVRDIRQELYSHINDLGIEFFAKQKTGFIMSRIINDVELVGKSLSSEFNDALNNVFYIVTHFAFLMLISWKMLLITLFIVPILMSPVSKFAQKIRRAAQGQQERLADMGGHVQEILSGIRVIRAFSMESFVRQRFGVINNELFKNTFKGHYYHQVGPALTELMSTFVILGFLVWGAHEMSSENLSRGLFFAFFFTLIFVMRPLKQVSVMVNLLSNTAVAANRIFDLLDTESEVKEHASALPFHSFEREIIYRNVSFRYPQSESWALQNIELKIQKGKTISFVGSSGAGKSTLLDLIPRFYDVTSGCIEVDGIDIRNFRLKNFRRSIGIVTQSIFLFNASIRDNISYGRKDISQSKIEEVARAANAHDFIEQMPQGYNTPIGERGVMLSGGQRQRIAIARALLRDPPILIFDEATSALDNESELLVQQAIERLLSGRTVFIIAHRLSTVYRSDEIVVMDRGRIMDRGKHEDLLEKSKIYRNLYEMQFSDKS